MKSGMVGEIGGWVIFDPKDGFDIEFPFSFLFYKEIQVSVSNHLSTPLRREKHLDVAGIGEHKSWPLVRLYH